MLSMQPIGYIRSPYRKTREIPKGLGAKHEAEGVLELRPEFEPGLADIEGFSHLFVVWAFDRSEGFDLTGTPRATISRSRPVHRGVRIRLG
jgi:tRNA (adenine37-N6)-methyltransferase